MGANSEYQYGTSPRKTIVPVKKEPISKKKPNVKSKKKIATKNKTKAFMVLSCIFVVMFAICYRYSQINQKFKEIQGVKKDYLALKATNEQMEIGIQSSLDLTNIERYAKDKLGMQKAVAGQIKYLNIEKNDKVEFNEDIVKEENILQNFFGKIAKVLE